MHTVEASKAELMCSLHIVCFSACYLFLFFRLKKKKQAQRKAILTAVGFSFSSPKALLA